MKDLNRRPLFIFEMANNHMGSVEHGCKIVQALREATEGFPFHFAVKLQYRDIDTFVHPDYRERFDLKFVKRFSETRISWDGYKKIKDAIEEVKKVSSVSRRRKAGEQERPIAAKVMKPLGELNPGGLAGQLLIGY